MKWSDPMCLLKRCDVKHITSYSKKKKKKLNLNWVKVVELNSN